MVVMSCLVDPDIGAGAIDIGTSGGVVGQTV